MLWGLVTDTVSELAFIATIISTIINSSHIVANVYIIILHSWFHIFLSCLPRQEEILNVLVQVCYRKCTEHIIAH